MPAKNGPPEADIWENLLSKLVVHITFVNKIVPRPVGPRPAWGPWTGPCVPQAHAEPMGPRSMSLFTPKCMC